MTGEHLVIVHISGDMMLCVDEVGDFSWIRMQELNVPWRWDRRRRDWIFAELEGEDDLSENEDGWGPPVSGHFPPDQGESDGDQGDEPNHGSGDMDTNPRGENPGSKEG